MAIGSKFARRTPATLYDLARQYLGQALPDISGIFNTSQASNIMTPTVVAPTAATAPAGLTAEQLALLYPQNLGGDGQESTGFGRFGNLDPTTEKTVVRNIYDEEVGDFVPTTLKAYKNINTGLFQTLEGKNIDPMFSNTGVTPGIIGAFTSALGFQPSTVGGYVPGSIQGVGMPDIFGIRSRREKDAIATKKGIEQVQAARTIREAEANPGGGPVDVRTVRDAIAASNRESRRGGQYDGGGGSPGSRGPGGSDEMGSF